MFNGPVKQRDVFSWISFLANDNRLSRKFANKHPQFCETSRKKKKMLQILPRNVNQITEIRCCCTIILPVNFRPLISERSDESETRVKR